MSHRYTVTQSPRNLMTQVISRTINYTVSEINTRSGASALGRIDKRIGQDKQIKVHVRQVPSANRHLVTQRLYFVTQGDTQSDRDTV